MEGTGRGFLSLWVSEADPRALTGIGGISFSGSRGATAGLVTTLARLPTSNGSADGTGSDARFLGPSGVAVDNAGNVYVSDRLNNTIRKGLPTPVIVTASLVFSGGEFGFELTGPYGHLVVIDASTDLLSWLPIMTNTFGADSLSFSDAQNRRFPHRYYRARLP